MNRTEDFSANLIQQKYVNRISIMDSFLVYCNWLSVKGYGYAK